MKKKIITTAVALTALIILMYASTKIYGIAHMERGYGKLEKAKQSAAEICFTPLSAININDGSATVILDDKTLDLTKYRSIMLKEDKKAYLAIPLDKENLAQDVFAISPDYKAKYQSYGQGDCIDFN